MQPYPAYKNSGVAWLGEVPAHWNVTRTKNLFRLRIQKSGLNHELELLSIYTHIGVRPRKSLEQKGNRASTTDDYWIVKKGDIIVNKLLAWMGAIGVSHFEGVTSPAYDILKPVQDIEADYYHNLYRTKLYLQQFKAWSRGIMDMRLRLYFDQLGAIPSIEPPISEQKQIARYLDWQTAKINKFIKAKKKLIALLKEQKQNIINDAVTKGINPDVKMKDSGVEWLGEIPEHWDIVAVKRLAVSIQTGPFGSQLHAHDYIENGVPLINPKHLRDGAIVPDRSCSISEENHQRLIRYSLCKSDLIMARRGEMGRCAIVTDKEDGWLCGTGSLMLRLREGYLFDRYLYLVMSSKGIAKALSLSSVGATMDNLNGTIVGNLVIPILAISEQQSIVGFIEKETALIERTIVRTEREIELIQEYRTRLVSDVVTGKVDVRNVVIPDFEPVEADADSTDEDETEDEPITDESEA